MKKLRQEGRKIKNELAHSLTIHFVAPDHIARGNDILSQRLKREIFWTVLYSLISHSAIFKKPLYA